MSQIAAKPADASVLDRLATRIEASRFADPTLSYTAKMFARGRAKIAQKVGEEVTAKPSSARAPICSIICCSPGSTLGSRPRKSGPSCSAARG
jgi:hypothetical protein